MAGERSYFRPRQPQTEQVPSLTVDISTMIAEAREIERGKTLRLVREIAEGIPVRYAGRSSYSSGNVTADSYKKDLLARLGALDADR